MRTFGMVSYRMISFDIKDLYVNIPIDMLELF